MDTKIIKVTDKGQICLPVKIREMLKIEKGDEIVLTQSNNAVVMRKLKREDFSDLLKHSEKVANKLWDNKDDEIWDTI